MYSPDLEDDICEEVEEEPDFNLGERATRLREVVDELEAVRVHEKSLNEEKSQIEYELMKYGERMGLTSFSAGRMSITMSPAMRAKYQPDKWNNIMQWAVETGNTQIIQRRTSDAKIEELAELGQLPDGLSMEAYTKISTRRL